MTSNLIKELTKDISLHYLNGETFETSGHYLQLSNQSIVDRVEDILLSNSIPILRRAWRSMYNHYIVYDYEPFSSSGFYIELYIDINATSYPFTEFLIQKTCSQIEHLNKCLAVSE